MLRKKKKKLKKFKCVSPFMKHLIEIKDDEMISKDDINEGEDDEVEEENDFYCPAIVSHLENKYLPYCFFWRHLL